MTWQTYEKTVRDIYETLGNKYDVKIEDYGPGCKRIGKSDIEHQIDVLTMHSDGIHSYQTAIECKYWKKKVNKDIVMKVIAVIQDCNIDRGVIVTKKGFTKDAQDFARYSNVQLVELREHNFSRKNEDVTKYYVHSEIRKPVLEHITFCFAPEVLNEVNSAAFTQGNVYHHFYSYPDGTIAKNSDLISRFLNERVLGNPAKGFITEIIKFPEGTIVNKPGSELSFPVKQVTLTGFLEWFTAVDDDYFENNVWMLMKVLFENKDFVINLNGSITNRLRPKNTITMQPNSRFFITARFFARNLSSGELTAVSIPSRSENL